MSVKLLIVDDVKFSLEIGKSCLENKGCEILTASNGVEALEVIKREHPDLVLTDYHMPQMGGDELCRSIKADPSTMNLPVVILTSETNAENLEKCESAGCDGILKKPFKKDEIIEKVKEYVDIICRQHKRMAVDLEVFYNSEEESYSTKIIDLSKGGMFVKNEEHMRLGTETDFFIVPEGEHDGLKVKGEVVRVVPKSSSNSYDQEAGMGIKFIDPSVEVLSIVDNYL